MTLSQSYVLRTSIPNYGLRNVELKILPHENDALTAELSAKLGTSGVKYTLEGRASRENDFDVLRLLMYKETDMVASNMLVLKQASHLGNDLSGFYDGALLSFVTSAKKTRQPTIPSLNDLKKLESIAYEFDTTPTTFAAALNKEA